METLLSTVAQISFTIVGLFFVVLTVDSTTRNRWLAQATANQYVRIILLIMLMPAFLSLGAMINAGKEGFPSWIVTSFILGVILTFAYPQLINIRRSTEHQHIINLETRLKISSLVLFNAITLGLLALFGCASFYVQDIARLVQQEEFLKILAVVSLVDSVLPVIHFAREFSNDKLDTQTGSALLADINVNLQKVENNLKNGKTVGELSVFVLVAALAAFLAGLFFNRN